MFEKKIMKTPFRLGLYMLALGVLTFLIIRILAGPFDFGTSMVVFIFILPLVIGLKFREREDKMMPKSFALKAAATYLALPILDLCSSYVGNPSETLSNSQAIEQGITIGVGLGVLLILNATLMLLCGNAIDIKKIRTRLGLKKQVSAS